MIVTEFLNCGRRVRHRSDRGMMIRKLENGRMYSVAEDTVPCRFTYEETETPVADNDTITAEEALEIITGGYENEEN